MYLNLVLVDDKKRNRLPLHEHCVRWGEKVVSRAVMIPRDTNCANCGKPVWQTELEDVADELRTGQEWHWFVASLIEKVPPGRLVSYECLDKLVTLQFGYSPGALNIAKFRRRLYGILTHDTRVPLHRVATKGCLWGENDSPETRCYDKILRTREGTYRTPDPWWCPHHPQVIAEWPNELGSIITHLALTEEGDFAYVAGANKQRLARLQQMEGEIVEFEHPQNLAEVQAQVTLSDVHPVGWTSGDMPDSAQQLWYVRIVLKRILRPR